MPNTWTPEQSAAIETRDKTLLISAAAGSGKTAVLTERIIRLLTDREDPASLERMLIVTFSRAAAAELRQRISLALGNALAADPGNRHLHRQLLALSSAKISTIHAYCLELIRTNFQRLGLPARFRIADDAEAKVLARTLMDSLISEHYAADEGFGQLADHFTGARNDKNLADTFLSLYQKLSTYPEGIAYLPARAEELSQNDGSMDRGWRRIAAGQTRRFYRDAADFFDRAVEEMADDEGMAKAYLPAFSADRDHIMAVLTALDSGDFSAVRAAVNAYTPVGLGSLRGAKKSEESEIFKARRDKFKERQTALRDSFFAANDELLAKMSTETADAIRQLHTLLAEYDRRLTEEKLRRGICDFSDIERYTLALLTTPDGEDSDVARDLAAGFDVICIDEYQDVNAVQDRIFRALARPRTRFMVGDIKQSIYRFRGAEPSIFADYRRTFPALGGDDGDSASIFMSRNFRCDLPVINTSNRIFAYLFGLCGESIGYLPEDDLVCGKNCPPDSPPAVLALTEKGDTEDGDEESTSEFRWVAAEIARLIREEKLDDGSPIRPRDIAILMRGKTAVSALINALEDADIPCALGASDNFFENPEVLMMLCLLNTIDNPNRDIYLVGTLRSPLFGFTPDELVAVRGAAQGDEPFYAAFRRYTAENGWEKGEAFLAKLAEYRTMAEGAPIDRLLNDLYRDTAVLAFAGADDPKESDTRSPEEKRANLLMLYDYARRFEAGSYRGLYNFIRYINDIMDEGAKIDAPPPSAEDAVRIMTIHQSKGLEFPVCFVCELGRHFNHMDAQANLLFAHDAGIALRLRDESGFARRTSPIFKAIAAHINDTQLEEEMRILYVALTRARERLYMTAQAKVDRDKLLADAAVSHNMRSADGLMHSTCYLDWVLTALMGTPEDCWQLVLPDTGETATAEADSTAEAEVPTAESRAPEAEQELIDLLTDRFSFRYPHEHLTRIPAKLAVSRLSPDLLDEDAPAELQGEVRLPEMRLRPAFLDGFAQSAGELAAERGTSTHVFLQFCDFSRISAPIPESIDRETQRLLEKGFITARMAELLHRDELAAFFAGPLYAELCAARWTLRERRFHLHFPAARFTQDAELSDALKEQQILVQGVIDLCFESTDGRLVLCDYKTDRLPHDRAEAHRILADRHSGQLGYYAEACRVLFGREPDRICLWSLALGEAVELK
ncbi:MAG: helicase-exonuclease AddAB subunit AddA [Ruminococcaceae bacterium]|nr:helicase-exonuclease AddAB subunit AddA [Oscillospiraceae bacterium]